MFPATAAPCRHDRVAIVAKAHKHQSHLQSPSKIEPAQSAVIRNPPGNNTDSLSFCWLRIVTPGKVKHPRNANCRRSSGVGRADRRGKQQLTVERLPSAESQTGCAHRLLTESRQYNVASGTVVKREGSSETKARSILLNPDSSANLMAWRIVLKSKASAGLHVHESGAST